MIILTIKLSSLVGIELLITRKIFLNFFKKTVAFVTKLWDDVLIESKEQSHGT
jgi:hypothetical protein